MHNNSALIDVSAAKINSVDFENPGIKCDNAGICMLVRACVICEFMKTGFLTIICSQENGNCTYLASCLHQEVWYLKVVNILFL